MHTKSGVVSVLRLCDDAGVTERHFGPLKKNHDAARGRSHGHTFWLPRLQRDCGRLIILTLFPLDIGCKAFQALLTTSRHIKG